MRTPALPHRLHRLLGNTRRAGIQLSCPWRPCVYSTPAALSRNIPLDQFPGQALAAELYLEGGIRSVEIAH